jgi:hypothetical protein
MRVESWPAHLIEPEHVGVGCAVGIDSNTIVDVPIVDTVAPGSKLRHD